MANWLFKEIPVYKIYLAWVGLLLVLCIIGSFFQPRYGKKRAQGVATRNEMRMMTLMLNQYIEINHRLPLGGNAVIVSNLSATFSDANILLFGGRTNSTGEIVDMWQVPFQIQVISMTNFIIHSAGPNGKLDDADDIIFNSASNGFVKP